MDHLAPAMLDILLDAGREIDLPVSGCSMGRLTRHATHIRIRPRTGIPAFGAVVLVEKKGHYIVHRVIRRDRRRGQIITKGDACPRADHPVALSDVKGRVIGTVRDGVQRVPPGLRFPWTVLLALNSRLQNRCRHGFPRLMRRLDIFRFFFTTWERILS